MAVTDCSDGLQVVPTPALLVDERHHYPHDATSKPFLDYGPGEVPEQKKPITILGLRRHHFFLFVAILMFVVVTTVGASIGGVISVQHSKHPSEPVLATVTVTATQSAISPSDAPNGLPAAVPQKIDIECPKVQEASDGTRYSCHQSQDVTPMYNVISSFKAFDLKQCIDQCISKNAESGSKRCKGVVVGKVVKGDVQNCWLKNVTGAMIGDTEKVFLALDA